MMLFIFKWFKPILIFLFDYNTPIPSFSTKKFFAAVFGFMSIYDKITLEVAPARHWIVKLTQLGVSSTVIIAVEASLAGLFILALGIYGVIKVQEKVSGVQ